MKTYIIPENEINRKWYLIDATDKILGRLAAEVAILLRGKNKPYFSPHQDVGDYVIIINASKIKVTGKKNTDKKYYRHSGYLGGLKSETLLEKMKKNPATVVRQAVWGMLPHNRLGRNIINKLKVYSDSKHNYEAKKLEEYLIK